MRRKVQKVKNMYILKKRAEQRKRMLKMAVAFTCRMVTVGTLILVLVAIAGEGPLMIERRALMLLAALILLPIATAIEKRIDTELPFDRYFEEEE